MHAMQRSRPDRPERHRSKEEPRCPCVDDLSLLGAVAIVAAACTTGGGASTAPSAAPSAAPTAAASEAASAPASEAASPSAAASVAPIAGGLLEKIQKAGKLVVSTDPKYPPQSELKPDGTYEGFDIDVATEIAKRLGVGIEFTTPDWTAITAGGWGGRWDVERRLDDDHRRPLEGARLQPAVLLHAGPDGGQHRVGDHDPRRPGRQDGLLGEGTTYDQWLNGTLDYGTGQDLGKPPAGVKTTTLPTDTDCPDQWKAGRNDFEGWLSSVTTVDGAIKAGLPLVKVGDPVYFEPLAVAVDKGGPDRHRLPADPQADRRRHACRRLPGRGLPEVVRGRLHAGDPVSVPPATPPLAIAGTSTGRPRCVSREEAGHGIAERDLRGGRGGRSRVDRAGDRRVALPCAAELPAHLRLHVAGPRRRPGHRDRLDRPGRPRVPGDLGAAHPVAASRSRSPSRCARSSSRRCSRSSAPSGGCRGPPPSTPSRRSTSRSSAARR